MTSDAERAELIALRELREAVADLAANRGAYWTRPGSREHDEKFGEQRAFRRVLQMIDGRIDPNGNRKRGGEPPRPSGESKVDGEPVGPGREAAALVLPTSVVPTARTW